MEYDSIIDTPPSFLLHGFQPVFVRVSKYGWVNTSEIAEFAVNSGSVTVKLKNGICHEIDGTAEMFWGTQTITPGT